MKKIIILLCISFFLSNNSGKAQIRQGKAIYEIGLTGLYKKSEEKGSMEFAALMKRVISASKDVQLELLFKNSESTFGLVETMASDHDGQYYQGAARLSTDGDYYINSKERVVLKTVENDKTYLIRIPFEQGENWELSKETRKIGDYLCYKATRTKTVKNSSGERTLPITAWYAPEIPAAFGPKNYHGLPGLILELREGKRIYRCTSITLDQQEKIHINRPEKGEKISQKEYDELIRRQLENFKNSIR